MFKKILIAIGLIVGLSTISDAQLSKIASQGTVLSAMQDMTMQALQDVYACQNLKANCWMIGMFQDSLPLDSVKYMSMVKASGYKYVRFDSLPVDTVAYKKIKITHFNICIDSIIKMSGLLQKPKAIAL